MEISQARPKDEVDYEISHLTLVPYPKRIIVLESKVAEKTEGGIYLPQKQDEIVSTEGYVMAVGEGCNFVKPGDLVYYERYSGAKCIWKGKEYRIMNEVDLLGVHREVEGNGKG